LDDDYDKAATGGRAESPAVAVLRDAWRDRRSRLYKENGKCHFSLHH